MSMNLIKNEVYLKWERSAIVHLKHNNIFLNCAKYLILRPRYRDYDVSRNFWVT